MGNRSIVQIVGADAAMYLQRAGHEAIEILRDAIPRMRRNSPNHSMARLIGTAHEKIGGNVGIAVWRRLSNPPTEEETGVLDSGVVVYDCETGMARCFYGSMGREHGNDPINLGLPPKEVSLG